MKKFSLEELFRLNHYEFEKYHDLTKIKKVPEKELSDKHWPKSWKEIYFKAYPRFSEVKLPYRQISKRFTLFDSLSKRSSERIFSKAKIPTPTLSSLLLYSVGLNKDRACSLSRRYYPSGGSRYPLEVYVILLNGQLKKGVYHYYPPNHSLELLIDIKELNIKKAFTPYNQTWAQRAGAIILITSIFKRSGVKYGENAYRFSLLEAGHMGQNISLLSVPLNLNCCAVAGYSSVYFEELLDIDGKTESIIYSFAVGKKFKE